MSPRRIRRIVLATALVAAALPAAASADTRIAQTAVTDPTGGATATVELWQRSSDGAVYPKVTVHDIRADNVCAHGSVNWKHESGTTYFDTGMYACGAGASKSYTKGARNWRSYDSVSISASVDNGPAASAPLHTFSSHTPPRRGTGALGRGDRCNSPWMTRATNSGVGAEFTVRMWPTRRARLAGRQVDVWVSIWEDLMRCAPFDLGLTKTQRSSLYKQLACHAVYGIHKKFGDVSWDLEARRKDIPWWQVLEPHQVALAHGCNWFDGSPLRKLSK